MADRREYLRSWRAGWRDKILDAYGARCRCPGCAGAPRESLCVSYGFGTPERHKKEHGLRTTTERYRWIHEHGYPPEFIVLCTPCQLMYRGNGRCGHSIQDG